MLGYAAASHEEPFDNRECVVNGPFKDMRVLLQTLVLRLGFILSLSVLWMVVICGDIIALNSTACSLVPLSFIHLNN